MGITKSDFKSMPRTERAKEQELGGGVMVPSRQTTCNSDNGCDVTFEVGSEFETTRNCN